MAAEPNRRVLYVGGLADDVTEDTVHAAFVPFGDLVEVTIPRDASNKTSTSRGFAFVEFEALEDADEARFNMNGAELFGRVLRVNVSHFVVASLYSEQVAKPMAARLGSAKPVWSADDWYKKLDEGAPPLLPRHHNRRAGGSAPTSVPQPGSAAALQATRHLNNEESQPAAAAAR